MEERFILFTVAGVGFAFNLREVSEVMDPQASYPIPGAPPHFVGMMNFHGVLTALADLGSYLGLAGRRPPGNVLVLDARRAQLALGVEAVRAIVPAEAILAKTLSEEPLVDSLISTQYGDFRLLRLDTLLFSLEQGLASLQKTKA